MFQESGDIDLSYTKIVFFLSFCYIKGISKHIKSLDLKYTSYCENIWNERNVCDRLKKIHEALTRQNVNPSEPSLWIRYLLNLTPGKWNNYWTIDVWTYLTTICGCECSFFWHISMCRLCVIEKCHACPKMTGSLRPERIRLG